MSVSIKPPVRVEKIDAYAEAFAGEHGSAIAVGALMPLLVEFTFFENDPRFKRYPREQWGRGAVAPALQSR